jgi:predicted nucleic acid-binding protein
LAKADLGLMNTLDVSWLIIQSPTSPRSFPLLGRGESDAISLALENPLSTLLIDDRAARKIAMSLGVSQIGTVGILKKAAELGLVNRESAFAQLKETDFRFPPAILDEILAEFVQRRSSET